MTNKSLWSELSTMKIKVFSGKRKRKNNDNKCELQGLK